MSSADGPALRNKVTGVAAAGSVVVLFVGFVLISKYGLRTALVPWDLAALRFAVAGLAMLPLALRYGQCDLGIGRTLVLAASGGLALVGLDGLDITGNASIQVSTP